MASNTTLVTRQHVGIFKHLAIAINLHQRVNMLMAMNEKMLSHTAKKYSFQNGRNSCIGWLHGTRTSRSTCHLERGEGSLCGFMTSQYSMLMIVGRKGGTTRMPA